MATPRSLKNATVTLTDNDGTNTAVLDLENGDLSFSVPNPVEHVADRGALASLIEGIDQWVTGSMTVQVQSLTAATSLNEIVNGTATSWDFGIVDTASGTYTGFTSTLASVASAVKVFQMSVALADPAGGSTETLYFLNCVGRLDFSEGMPSNFTLTFDSYQTDSDFYANIA
jgi:hypothetical protein